MKKILVTGATGQLGRELQLLSGAYTQYQWVFADRATITLDNLPLLERQLATIQPNIVINCGAFTAVDKAESQQQLADTVNHLAVGVLAAWTTTHGAQMLHVSTDYVFDGNAASARTEEAQTNPINVYGATKLLGEQLCLQNNPEAIILRTSWVYSSFGNNFVKTMSALMQERDSLNVVQDQIGSPTYAADLAQAIVDILTGPKWVAGIYNFSNQGEVSWYEFALAIQQIGGFSCKITGIPSSAYPTPAKRPFYSLLDKTKIAHTFGVAVPHYKESLKKAMALIEAKK
ncbi:dTDP-4-dehydrorhamnose reductase [Flavobacterium crassostreae]|uniref:dTDP-4-dehydrorhamnose reductase n=1 Tax=Flavobacterium crassostreae TaxID=1763534 RepID=A0A1B9E3P7_9FLAO|nr:dTDP-4-dehydrorhamnose reductase [Flavobacterium crassostreae]OCB76559.1 NAD(P)-dependent oxidoreductase [Flavobacterium crassostreae]